MPPPDKRRNRQFVSLRDFRPGIWTRSLYGGSGAVGATVAPLGAAQYGTYGCVALPGGGLGPAPKKVTTFAIPDPDAANYASGPIYVGLGSLGPLTVSPISAYPDELFVGIEWITTNTGVRRFRQYRLRVFDSPYGNDNLLDVTTTSTSPSAQFWGQTWTSSRMATTSAASGSTNYTIPGAPVYVTEWSEAGLGGVKYVNTYPDPRAPGTNVMTSTLLSGSTAPATSRPGQIIGHQNRVVLLEDMNNVHPSTNSGAIPSNEQISFTDPANSNTPIGTQKQVFVAEYPNGYGAWGSISAGELFLVKNQGGGVVVAGDIAAPNVVRLPGVVSTGAANAYYKAASTPKGLFYLTTQQGAYVWRGSDTSTKISQQLEDNFAVTSGSGSTINIRGQLSEWGDWVCFPGGWLYDTNVDAWFFLDDPAAAVPNTFDYWVRSFSARYMYAMRATQTPASAVVAVYDRLTPVLTWLWKSQPIVLDNYRVTDIREIAIVAQGAATSTFVVKAYSDSVNANATDSVTFTLPAGASTIPVLLRQPISAKAGTIVLDITATGPDKAPFLYELIVGFDETALAGVA
jgi:hypothetical protein